MIALVGWRLVARVRRLVGRQRLQLWRHRATVLVFPFAVGLIFIGALGETASLLALAAGAAAGGALALVGFRRTRFEVTDGGALFYTPCAPIGIGLGVMLIARIAYRALEIFEAGGSVSPGADSLALTPGTLFVFATLASYYSAYSLGLLLWHARVERRR